ncbi:integrating conjugative element membrane protein, PFL_4697 family [Salmonella enterica subsp. enterica serovar Sanjuan]|uniref:Integrating conjugative element membrane protein, PFL_4697 family n=1 Tax=Salmonella enterica subsp. enterica serovar Sanjuan TaxID=1160765 RepID=A0A3S4EXU4_SALET|nr:integrating conjugative element membrane protein, PFL_4697 family [Salmonella enterica subsp. enterica serovar Sanjuan]
MIPRTHRQLVSVEVMWPAQTLPLPLQQAVEALTQGETPDQIIARMNLQGFQAWREATSPQDEHDVFQIRLDEAHEARFLCRYITLPLHLMPEHAPPGPVRRPGILGWIALLPGVLVGFCLGAWMLAIALEWLGDAFFWRNTCASHSEQVLQATWQWWQSSAGAPVWLVENLALISDTLQQGIAALIASINGQSGLFWTETVTMVIRCALLSAAISPSPFCCG